MKKLRIRIPSAFLATSLLVMGTPAFAGQMEFLEQTTAQESTRDMSKAALDKAYNTPNQTGSSAWGRYQILVSNFQRRGLVRRKDGSSATAKRWDQIEFTELARSRGVSSLEDLGLTEAGRMMQDDTAIWLAHSMWDETAPSRHMFTKEVSGYHKGKQVTVTVNEPALLGATWFLGSGNMNEWARGGMTLEALRNLEDIDQIMTYNPSYKTVEELHGYLVQRMANHVNLDITDITDGQYTPGQVVYSEEEYVYCDPEISEQMQKEGETYVNNIVAAAQDDVIGYSQMKQDFGEMSCIDFSFLTGFDVLFNIPSIGDIGAMVREMACEAVGNFVAETTAPLNETMRSFADGASFDGVGFGPISAFSLDVQATNDVVGVDAGVTGGQYRQTNPLTGEVISNGIEGGGQATPIKPAIPPNFSKDSGSYSGLFQK
jgi:hypothetical protein